MLLANIFYSIIVIIYRHCCCSYYYYSLPLAVYKSSCYDALPVNEVICASIGDSFEIYVQHIALPSFLLACEDSDGIYIGVDDNDVCGGDESVCVLDSDAARFHDLQF